MHTLALVSRGPFNRNLLLQTSLQRHPAVSTSFFHSYPQATPVDMQSRLKRLLGEVLAQLGESLALLVAEDRAL